MDSNPSFTQLYSPIESNSKCDVATAVNDIWKLNQIKCNMSRINISIF